MEDESVRQTPRPGFREIPVQHRHHRMLPVWFFIGVLLLVYGIIILVTSLADLQRPTHVVLAGYHAGVWGGVILHPAWRHLYR